MNRTAMAKRVASATKRMGGRGRTPARKMSDYCGKGQYKSLECKAKSIEKAAIERGNATRREQPYLQWLDKQGLKIKTKKAARAKGYDV